MAHNYVITSASYISDPNISDPQVVVVGSVDAEPVTVTCYLSEVPAGVVAQKNFIAPRMLAQATKQIAARTPVVTNLQTGSFSQ